MADALAYNGISHGPIRTSGGGCGTLWFITELEDKEDFATMMLTWDGGAVRILAINEPYYLDYKPGDYHHYDTQFGKSTVEFLDEDEDEDDY